MPSLLLQRIWAAAAAAAAAASGGEATASERASEAALATPSFKFPQQMRMQGLWAPVDVDVSVESACETVEMWLVAVQGGGH